MKSNDKKLTKVSFYNVYNATEEQESAIFTITEKTRNGGKFKRQQTAKQMIQQDDQNHNQDGKQLKEQTSKKKLKDDKAPPTKQ